MKGGEKMRIFSLFVICILLVFSVGFVFAEQAMGTNQNDNMNKSDDGNGTGLSDQNQNAGETQNMEENKMMVRDGEYAGEGGKMFQIQTKANNEYMLKANGVEANCSCNMTQEKVQNKTMLKVHLSNGKNAEVKVMPDRASEKALERLRLKVCSEENNCEIELKEVGKGNDTQLAYEMQIERHSRILGIFGSKMQVKTQVNAETGEVVKVDKPWWAFLASEPAEE